MDLSAPFIRTAYQRIDPIFLDSPQFELDAVNEVLGTRLVLKVETLNPIRSFKGRGSDYFVQSRGDEAPFACASAGNFGQGMAYACRKHGLSLTIYSAENANPLKLKRMRRLGAKVILAGRDFDVAKDACRDYARAQGLRFVEDGKDIEVSIGAGTIGLELSRYPADIETVLVPLGNGALINGIGAWFKAERPRCKVVGVVAENAPSMELSWRRQQLVTTEQADTIADGIAVRRPVPEALEHMKATVDEVVRVSEDKILEAMTFIHRHAGLVVEAAGAVGVAAVLADEKRFDAQVVATVLCGGNVTAEQLDRWL